MYGSLPPSPCPRWVPVLFRDGGKTDFGRVGSTLDNRWHPWVPQMNHEMLPVSRTNLSLVLAGTGGHLSILRDRSDPAREITRIPSGIMGFLRRQSRSIRRFSAINLN